MFFTEGKAQRVRTPVETVVGLSHRLSSTPITNECIVMDSVMDELNRPPNRCSRSPVFQLISAQRVLIARPGFTSLASSYQAAVRGFAVVVEHDLCYDMVSKKNSWQTLFCLMNYKNQSL